MKFLAKVDLLVDTTTNARGNSVTITITVAYIHYIAIGVELQ